MIRVAASKQEELGMTNGIGSWITSSTMITGLERPLCIDILIFLNLKLLFSLCFRFVLFTGIINFMQDQTTVSTEVKRSIEENCRTLKIDEADFS